jgi:hypothetical protein
MRLLILGGTKHLDRHLAGYAPHDSTFFHHERWSEFTAADLIYSSVSPVRVLGAGTAERGRFDGGFGVGKCRTHRLECVY